jgi:hypothetical protein
MTHEKLTLSFLSSPSTLLERRHPRVLRRRHSLFIFGLLRSLRIPGRPRRRREHVRLVRWYGGISQEARGTPSRRRIETIRSSRHDHAQVAAT